MKESFKLTDLRSMPRIKKAAYKEPVMLTENGAPEFVLMTITDYENLKKGSENEK